MAEILVLVDHADGVVRKPALELLTLARRIGEPSAVVLGAGAAAADIAAKAGEYGAAKVYVADGAEFADQLVVPKVDALAQIAKTVSPAAVLVTSSGEGKEVAARVALRIGSGIITDAVDGRGRRRLACRRRRGLVPAQQPGRPDRQAGLPAALHRGGPDLRAGRLRRGRRPLPGAAAAHRRGAGPQGLNPRVGSEGVVPGARCHALRRSLRSADGPVAPRRVGAGA